MDLAAAILARLSAAGAVTDLVDDRIYWSERDQSSALPAIVLAQISRVRDDGLAEAGDILVSRVQASCLAASHESSWAVAKAVEDALRDEAEVDGFLFWEADVEGPLDLTTQGAATAIMHEASIDIILRHSADV